MPDQICGAALTGRSVSKLEPSAEFTAAKVSLAVREAVHRPARHYGETHSRRLASRLRHLRRHRMSSSVTFTRTSKLRNARSWFSSVSAVPRLSDEASAKSSAKWINFSRHAGSLISRGQSSREERRTLADPAALAQFSDRGTYQRRAAFAPPFSFGCRSRLAGWGARIAGLLKMYAI